MFNNVLPLTFRLSIRTFHSVNKTRVEVNFRKKCSEKKIHRVFLTSFCGECGELRWIIYFHRVLSTVTKKNRPYTDWNLWLPAKPSPAYSTAPTVNYFNNIPCEFKLDWVNVGKQMLWIFVRNAVKSGEWFFFTAITAITAFLTKIHRIHRISCKNLPKNLDPGTSTCMYLS